MPRSKKRNRYRIIIDGNRWHLTNGKVRICSSRGYLKDSYAMKGANMFKKLFKRHPKVIKSMYPPPRGFRKAKTKHIETK